jgi:hypothetical protein
VGWAPLIGDIVTTEQPRDEGGYWDAHPLLEDWKYEVANDDTRQSFREWLEERF